MNSFSKSSWCSFRSIPSAAETCLVSESCLFSLATLEVTRILGSTSFALTECENSTAWRWAIISPDGLIVVGGREPTRAQARQIAEEALGFDAA